MFDTRKADLLRGRSAQVERVAGRERGAAERGLHRQTFSNAYLNVEIVSGKRGGVARFDWNDRGRWASVFRRAHGQGDRPGFGPLSCYPLIQIADPGNAIRTSALPRGVALPDRMTNPVEGACALPGEDWTVDVVEEKMVRLKAACTDLYRASQTYWIDGPTLEMTVEVENMSPGSLACGIGIHPVIVRDPDTWLSAPASGLWIEGRAGQSAGFIPTPSPWQFGVTYPLPATKIDHAFTGWGGKTLVEWPARQFSLVIEANTDSYRLHAVPGEDSFSFEVANDRAESCRVQDAGDLCGLTVLAARETLMRRTRFAVERLGSLTRTARKPSK
ncbi:aldose 1-epimerase [Paraburkholderia sp. B3]|uniref:aldose 1-epimerase n=1 Tax=Paraburkholderia sp. B3 TaxID=3134791 RepID=UPI003981C310